MLSIALPGKADGEGGPTETGDGGFRVVPREGLTVAFRMAVETIDGQLLQAIVLGLLIATFTMVGVDKRGL